MGSAEQFGMSHFENLAGWFVTRFTKYVKTGRRTRGMWGENALTLVGKKVRVEEKEKKETKRSLLRPTGINYLSCM